MVYDEGTGGGFVPDYNSNANDDSSQTRRDTPTTRAVTIKQLTDATSTSPGDNLIVDGTTLVRIKLVGILRNITSGSTRTKFIIEDGTGSIEVFKWNSDDRPNFDGGLSQEDSQRDLTNTIGDYVEMTLLQKSSSGNERMFVVTDMRTVTDYNAVIYHYLSAIKNHLMFTKGSSGVKKAEKQEDNGIFVDDSVSSEDVKNAIINAINSFGDKANGCHIQTITDSLNFSPEEVKTQVFSLVDDGKIWEPESGFFSLC